MGLEFVQVEPAIAADACVIWLHGLGADGYDFEPMVQDLDAPKSIRYIMPHAPVRPVTINAGVAMRAWYDIDLSAPLAGTVDIDSSAREIEQFIDGQRQKGIATHRIVLAGFSQGGVIVMRLGLRLPYRVAGIVALSTYIHDHDSLDRHMSSESKETPIFMAHGLMDPMIPISLAVAARDKLLEMNCQVEWHEYGVGHGVSSDEVSDIGQFLSKVLART